MEENDNLRSAKLNSLALLLKNLGLSEAQNEKILDNLGRAVYLNAFSKLNDMLSPEARKKLETSRLKDPEEISQILASSLSKEEIEGAFGDAVKEVMEKFLDKV